MSNKKFSNNNFLDKGKDRALLWKLRKKDEEAFIRVYEKYVDDIYRFIYFKIGKAEEARDITANVFLKTWNYIQEDKLKDAKSLKSFVYMVARNCVIDHYRQDKTKTHVQIDNDDIHIDIVDEGQDVIKEAEINFDIETVKDKLEELKDEYREVIILKYINELDFSEIARITGRSKNSTRVLTHRALKTLKELMEG